MTAGNNPYSLAEHPQSYLHLWEYFTSDAQSVKDRMWTLATWLYAGLTGLLGFAAEKCFNSTASTHVGHMNLTMAVCAIGALFSAYSVYLLYMYGMHIRSAWNKADYLRKNIQGLSDVWYIGNMEEVNKDLKSHSNSKKLPPVALYLILIAASYGLMFIGLAFISPW